MNRPPHRAFLPSAFRLLSSASKLLPAAALVTLAACQGAVAPTPLPTPNFRPTIETLVDQQVGRALDDRIPALQSTIAARVSGTVVAALPTPLPRATPTPQPTAAPTATARPVGTPTATPPLPTPTPTPPGPTPTAPAPSTPTVTPPTPTATPTPGPDFLAFAGSSVVRIGRPSGTAAGATTASGVIVETSPGAGTALVLTNASVTASARQVNVVVEGTRTFAGKVIGEDVQRDLALIEICCGAFSATSLPGTAGVENGKLVGIVGYPSATATAPEAATSVVLESRFVAARERFEIVFDRAITAELSGAAVFDSTGRFVGLATYSAGAEASAGTGLAIAPATIVAALPAMRDGPAAVIATPTPSVPTTGGILFGPVLGSLVHDPAAGQPITFATAVDVADSIVVATFTNPYATSEGSWSYGLRFRSKGARLHTVFVRSDGTWHHWVVDDQGNPLRVVQTQGSSAIGVASGATNTLRIMAVGNDGYFFINSTFVARLDLSGLTSSGDVVAVTGLFTGDQLAGKSTAYKDLTVTKIADAQSVPSGTLIRSTSGFIATDSAGVNLLDSVIDVRFTNPSPAGSAWSSGVLIRQASTNMYHAVFVASDGYWYHHARTGTTASDHQVQRQKLTAITTATGSTNRLQVFASGAEGWLFVNGQFAGTLDLSEVQAPGDVRVIAGYFTSHQAVGVKTSFDSFTVRPIR